MKNQRAVTCMLLVLLVLVGVAPARLAWAQDDKDAPTLDKGDVLADEGRYDEAIAMYMRAYERLLPQMRGVTFNGEVDGRMMPRKELEQYILKLAEEELEPEEIRGDELLLKALGLVPKDFDLKQTMVTLMTEEIAGFYDSEKKAMFLIQEALPPGPRKEPGLFARMFGAKPAFDKDQTKAVLAHEMAHALADQNFDLETMTKAAEGDSEREIALAALVEGEAMLVMIAASDEDWTGERTAQVPPEFYERMLSMMGRLATASGGKAFGNAPPIIQEALVFPYLRGMVFCAHIVHRNGWAGLDAVYRNPPLSTEQILHPEKYLGEMGENGEYDGPQMIEMDLDPGEGWSEVTRDLMGELGVEVMLRKQRGQRAAQGWDGDTCVVFEGPEQSLGVVWMTTWDSKEDAREFAAAYADYQGSDSASLRRCRRRRAIGRSSKRRMTGGHGQRRFTSRIWPTSHCAESWRAGCCTSSFAGRMWQSWKVSTR